MATRSVAVTEEQGALLEGLVAEGRYLSLHDALAVALELPREDKARMDALVERLNRSHREALDLPPSDEAGEEQLRRIVRAARAEWEAKEAVGRTFERT